VRTECLDWLLILNQPHLERVLRVYVRHYNHQRPHRGLGLVPPQGQRQLEPIACTGTGDVQSVAVGDSLYISNSLALLLTWAGEDLDLTYQNYFFDYLNYFRKGITITVKPIRLRSGNRALLHDCCNIAVSRDLAIGRIEKRTFPAPSCGGPSPPLRHA
jgi:hypothetical protein